MGQIQPGRIHDVTGLMLGGGIAGNPYGGYIVRVARDIAGMLRGRGFTTGFQDYGRSTNGQVWRSAFREGVNTILAANGVVWDLNKQDIWRGLVPEPLRQQVHATSTLLAGPGVRRS